MRKHRCPWPGGLDDDFVEHAACALWERLLPDRPRFEMLDERMQAGYAAFWANDVVRAGDHWLAVWDCFKPHLGPEMTRVRDVDAIFQGSEYFFNWCPEFENELGNAGVHDPRYWRARIQREYRSDPTQMALVPPELFDRGRQLALRLAEEPSRTVLLHGDFTPVNVLDGGERRGLVAIDPCPTLGDPAFDAIDLLFWQAGDLDTISRRVESLAPAIGVDGTRQLDWCIAFGSMAAADLTGTGQRAEPPGHTRNGRVKAALSLAAQAPSP